MADTDYANLIRTEPNAATMREEIANGIEQAQNDANSAVNTANNASNTANTANDRVNNILSGQIEGKDQEVLDAHYSNTTGQTAPNIGARMDGIDSDLADMSTQVNGIDRGIGGTYANLAAIQTAFPTGDTKRYVSADTGLWYWWNDTAWVSGGTFQGIGIAKKEVRFTNLNTDIQTSLTKGSEITESNFTQGVGLSSGNITTTNSKYITNEDYINPYTDTINISNLSGNSSYLWVQIAYYDKNEVFLSQTDFILISNNIINLDTATDYEYVRLSFVTSTSNTIGTIIAWGTLFTITLGIKALIADQSSQILSLNNFINSKFIKNAIINQNDFTLGYGLSGTTGAVITANNKFLVTEEYFKPYGETFNLSDIANTSTYLMVQIAYYDENKNFISAIPYTLIQNNTFSLDSTIDYAFIRLSLITCTDGTTNTMVIWNYGSTLNYALTLTYTAFAIDISNSHILTVGKSGCMFTSLQEAVRHCTDEDTILLFPGTYEECINTADDTYGNKATFKSIIGVDKEKCIITSHLDLYGSEPLWVSKGYFKNLSIISDDTKKDGSNNTNAYALHLDNNWEINTKAIFENVYFYSKNTAAVGIGTRPNCNIVFKNCGLETPHNTNIDGNHLGALFFHNSADSSNQGANQDLEFDDCDIKSTYGSAVHVQRVGDDTNIIELTVKKTMLWSDANGTTNVVDIDDSLYTGVSGNNINITGKTFGNNVDIATYIN